MLFRSSIPILFFSFYLFLSCNNKATNDLPRATIEPMTKPAADYSDFDYYFTPSKDTTSTIGPKTIVRNILEDKDGTIWLATWAGIISYNGKKFTNHTNKESLRRWRVFTMLEDRKGNLWFGTVGAGLYKYDGKNFTNLTTADGLVDDSIGCLYEDDSGKLWIGTMGGVSCYDGKSFKNYTAEHGLADNDTNSITQDAQGKLWIGARGHSSRYDGKYFTTIEYAPGNPFTNVRCILADQGGNIWLGGNDGLWRYDGNNYLHVAKNFTGYIYEDRQENIWTSSSENGNDHNGQLMKYEPLTPPVIAPTSTLIHKDEDMFFGILEDLTGGIWLGSLKGVRRYDGKEFSYFKS